MKNLTNLLIALVLAGWISAIAILSVQNATLVSLKFLIFQSIQLPIGILLGFSAGLGIIAGVLVPLLWQLSGSSGENQQFEDTGSDDEDDF